MDSYQSAECGGAPELRRLSCSPVAVCVYTWMKHQLAIYSNNQADGVTSCLCTDSVAAPAEATRLQPVVGGGEWACQTLSRPWCASLARQPQGSPAGRCNPQAPPPVCATNFRHDHVVGGCCGGLREVCGGRTYSPFPLFSKSLSQEVYLAPVMQPCGGGASEPANKGLKR